jgi:epsilon-lactone hydrolase
MPHVFQSSLGQFLAAEQSVNAIANFLRQRLIDASPSISTTSEV